MLCFPGRLDSKGYASDKSLSMSFFRLVIICAYSLLSGPMSFIEYENVEYATRALSDLYGHTLGGLVKGGIRLSYSKNPLVSAITILGLHMLMVYDRAFDRTASRKAASAAAVLFHQA